MVVPKGFYFWVAGIGDAVDEVFTKTLFAALPCDLKAIIEDLVKWANDIVSIDTELPEKQ